MLLYRNVSQYNIRDYKKFHESFMENNHGSTAFHTFLCIFFTVQCTILCSIVQQNSGIVQYLFEYIVIVLPLICAHTIFSEYIYILNLIVFIITLNTSIINFSKFNFNEFFKQNIHHSEKISCISCLRGLTYLITVLCILAVDFQDFPRNLAKTENYGFSLMDTGVGLFVMMSGLVHKDVRKESIYKVLKGNIKFITILMVLGITRYVSIKSLNYQEHVTEYGVHWNFFFTLAICKFCSSVLLYCSDCALLFSLLTMVVHELALYIFLEDWVFGNTPRNNLLTANREGISSCLGYISLYLFSAFVKGKLKEKSIIRFKLVCKLLIGGISLWLIFYVLTSFRPVSRKLANASYCIYLNAMLLTVVPLIYVFEILYINKEAKIFYMLPKILAAVNGNGLVYFLVSNLLTGFINMSVKTLLVTSEVTFVILNFYMIATITICVYFNHYGLKL